MAFAVTPSARAQDAGAYIVTYVEVLPTAAADTLSLLRTFAAASRKEDGSQRVDLLQRVSPANQFVVVAIWKDAKAYEAHAAGAPAKDFAAAVAPLLVAPIDTRVHTGLSVAPAAAGKPRVLGVTHVDVIPTRRDDGTALVRQLGDDGRKDKGNLRFDVYQQTSRPNHFSLVEAWASQQALDDFDIAAHTRDFRAKLAPMSGALFDRRLYRGIE